MAKYLDIDGLQRFFTGVKGQISGKLDKSGGTMTGALTLSGAPTANLHACTKKYVDDICGDVEAVLEALL